ncbi:MAG TPA: hypothetical protein VIH35_04080 [Kiritimatiellia bacterium]|jgi:hypothetical protein
MKKHTFRVVILRLVLEPSTSLQSSRDAAFRPASARPRHKWSLEAGSASESRHNLRAGNVRPPRHNRRASDVAASSEAIPSAEGETVIIVPVHKRRGGIQGEGAYER